MAIHLLGAIMALVVPANVLTEVPLLKSFVYFIAQFLPVVINFSIKSSFPELMQLCTATLLLTVPYWIYIYLKWPGMVDADVEMLQRFRASWKYRLLLGFCLIFGLPGLINYLFFVVGKDFHLAPFQSSRLALALFGPVMFCWGPTAMVTILVLKPWQVLIRYFKGK